MKKGSHGVIFFIYLIMLQLCSGGSRCSHLNSDEKQQGQFSCIITRLCLLQQLPHGTTFLPLLPPPAQCLSVTVVSFVLIQEDCGSALRPRSWPGLPLIALNTQNPSVLSVVLLLCFQSLPWPTFSLCVCVIFQPERNKRGCLQFAHQWAGCWSCRINRWDAKCRTSYTACSPWLELSLLLCHVEWRWAGPDHTACRLDGIPLSPLAPSSQKYFVCVSNDILRDEEILLDHFYCRTS